MTFVPALPRSIGSIAVPDDRISAAVWTWAYRRLPGYLFAHSVRSYCWGACLAAREGLRFDARILWPASLLHDIGLIRVGRADRCFEFEGAAVARRFLLRQRMADADAERVARAIELHMAPTVTLADGVESLLLDRATGIDVRGSEIASIASVREEVVAAFPRGAFDRRFVAALRREVAIRRGCQSARLLDGSGLERTMARSGWRDATRPAVAPAVGVSR